MINKQTLQHIKRELAFFETYKGTQRIGLLIQEYERIKKIVLSGGEDYAVLRLGGGVGFHAVTGDWQFENHINTGIWSEKEAQEFGLSRKQKEQYVGNYKKFKSRKIAFSPGLDAFWPMGYIMLSTTEPAASQASTPEPLIVEEPKIIEPEFFKGRLNKNSILDAVVIKAFQGRRAEVEVYLHEPLKKKAIMLGYNNPDKDAIIQVRLERNPGEKGELIKEVHFLNFKK